MMPLNKVALGVVAWAVVAALSFFFHPIAFLAVFLIFIDRLAMFAWLVEALKEPPNDSNTKYEQLTIPGIDCPDPASMGTNGEGSLRENIPASEAERREGDLG